MAGSMKSAILFLIAAIFCVIQLIVAIVAFDDVPAAVAAGVFVFVNIIGFLFARTGSMMAVFRTVGTYGNVEVRQDTGQRIQGTPCFGFCFGIITIFVAYLFAEMIGGSLGLLAISPAIVAGIFSILAGIVFALDYKGPYSRQVY